MRDYVCFYVNGKRVSVSGESAFQSLGVYLRRQRLVGTKIVCAEGDCGSCTILRAKPTAADQPLFYETINSCIALVHQMDGCSLITVEGLKVNGKLSISNVIFVPWGQIQEDPCVSSDVITELQQWPAKYIGQFCTVEHL